MATVESTSAERIDARDLRCELALARGALYRVLALAFRHPDPAWRSEMRANLAGAVEAARACADLRGSPAALCAEAEELAHEPLALEALASEHARVLGHTPRASATPYETEWGGAAGDLLQFHQIADVAAFYNAFCVELGARCDERADHVAVELEFLQYLAVKEAWAEDQRRDDLAALCRDTSRQFLEEHLGRWAPAFARRAEAASDGGYYAAAARLLRAWIGDEARALGIAAGDAALEPSATSFREEDACISCSLASTCTPEMRRGERDGGGPDDRPGAG